MSLKGKNVLFFAGPLYEDLELWYPKIRLEEEGAATVVAGLGERTYQGKRGYPVTVDTNVDQVEAADFNGLVIPGGFAPDQLRRYEKVLAITRAIFQAETARVHLSRRVGADFGEDPGREARDERAGDQGRHGERRRDLARRPGGGGRQPDLLAHARHHRGVLPDRS